MQLRLSAVLVAAVAAAACTRLAPLTITLDTQLKTIDINGLPSAQLAALAKTTWTDEDWQALVRVSVKTPEGAAPAAVVGRYGVSGATLRFTPTFPFDQGRQYEVVFNPGRLPGSAAAAATNPIVAIVSLPGVARAPSTVVTHVYPSGDTVPANQLRMYLHFSAPMDWRSGYDYVRLLNDRGDEVPDAFLPLDVDFWNGDRTRYTVFFDPGRVKRGILPNRQMGRALVAGKRYTLVVRRDWRDGHGQPLKEEFRRSFTATPAIEQALSMRAWKVTAPAAGTREPLSVTFPAALDHGLLQRALGVARGGAAVEGESVIDASETCWRFTPKAPWPAGRHELVALEFLEDLAGNRIGRPFEADSFERTDISSTPAQTTLPFTIAAGR